MKAVELRRAPRGGDHRAKEDNIGPAALDLIEHFIIIETQRAAIENGDFGGLLLSDKRANLGMKRIDGQVLIAPGCPIAHRRRDKKEFHAVPDFDEIARL
jgi:hypothetical protein